MNYLNHDEIITRRSLADWHHGTGPLKPLEYDPPESGWQTFRALVAAALAFGLVAVAIYLGR